MINKGAIYLFPDMPAVPYGLLKEENKNIKKIKTNILRIVK